MTTSEVRCPIDGAQMRIRTARRGPNAGGQFYGCVNYPTCRGTVNIDERNGGNTSNGGATTTNQPSGSGSGSTNGFDYSQSPEELLNIPRVVSVQARESNYQAKHFQTIQLPSSYVDQLYVSETKRSLQRTFAQWRLDFPTSGQGVPRELAPVIAVCEAIMNRGPIPYCTPRIEELSGKFDPRSEIDASLIGQAEASLSVPLKIGIGNDGESIFQEVINEFLDESGNSGWSVVPEMHLSALNQTIDADAQNRCDFLISHVTGPSLVVEIDGPQHDTHVEIDQYRNEKLQEVGIDTIRIPTEEVRAKTGPNFDRIFAFLRQDVPQVQPNEKALNLVRLSRFAHQVQASILEMIRGGWISKTSETKIQVAGPNGLPKKVVPQWMSGSVDDLSDMLARSASLLGLEESIPKFSVDLIGSSSAKPDVYLLPGDESFDSGISIEDAPKFYYSDVAYPFAVSSPTTASRPALPSKPSEEDALWFLWYIFRKEKFREGQWDVVRRSLQNKDSVVLLPTGAGKSIAFQLSALLLPGRCISVDPIISLIDDQVDNLWKVGIDRVIGISGQLNQVERKQVLANFSAGQYLFCYVAPVRLQMTDFREALRGLTVFVPVSLIVIDEAHCVSEWGHSFVTAYLNIGRISREYCSIGDFTPPLVALTGTASKIVLRDVQRELGIEDFEAIITPTDFNRSNLIFNVISCSSEEKQHRLRGFLERLPSDFGMDRGQFFRPNGKQTMGGMIFCPHVNGDYGTVAQANFIADQIGTEVAIYSGTAPRGFNKQTWNDQKKEAARRFKRNEVTVIACTKAFGMGIDNENVRFTAHIGVPPSIEAFYQEAGRAGRDQINDAQCAIILSNDDPERTNRLLSPNTSISEIATAVDEAGWDDSDDIIRSLFFHVHEFKGEEFELQDLRQVTEELNPGQSRARINKSWARNGGLDQDRYEKALHRLVVLGVVADYTVDYSSREFNITLSGISNEGIAESLGVYIGAYNSRQGRRYEQNAKAIGQNTKAAYIVEIGRLLIEFIYEHIEQSRRASMWTMVTEASRAVSDGETLRKGILDYLEHAEFDSDINNLLGSDEGGLDSLAPLLENIANPRDAANLRGAVQQALASYPDLPALHLLRGLTEALDEDAQTAIVEESIKAFIRFSISTYGISAELVATSLVFALSMPALNSELKRRISEIATMASLENTNLLRGFVAGFPREARNAPATALIKTYLTRVDSLLSERVPN